MPTCVINLNKEVLHALLRCTAENSCKCGRLMKTRQGGQRRILNRKRDALIAAVVLAVANDRIFVHTKHALVWYNQV